MLRRACTRSVRPGAAVLLASTLLIAVSLAACFGRAPNPPDAEFLVATADSTFWVHSGANGIRVRAVPMTLTRFGGHFHEVFIADVDRSFSDAIFTGERVYVRDLQSNDSTLVYDDTTIVTMAAHHARAYPDATPLGPDDETPTDPRISVSGETDVLEVRGPYALLEHRSAYEMPAGAQHDTVHTAVDLRSGAAATQGDMSRDSASDDSNVVRDAPRSWGRKGYRLNARASGDGSVSISLRDGDDRSWPLFSVGAHPRLYWLDDPAIDGATRRALVRAFNSAAAYDEAVKYAKYMRPAPKTDLARAPVRHA
ncbi:MAG: hypothetical protein ABI322_11830 [Gemmatimonadaceae bacterium]